MFRILLLVSALPIAATIVLTWWFGTRVLWAQGKRMCRADLGKWTPDDEAEGAAQSSEATAKVFGIQVRNQALKAWKEQSPKLAKAREGNRAFGMAVPPLSGVVVVFAAAVGRLPPFGAITIFVMATAISAVLGMLSLPSELTAVRRYIKSDKFKGSFPNSYDEESVIACALAQVWESGLPPILRWLQPGSRN